MHILVSSIITGALALPLAGEPSELLRSSIDQTLANRADSVEMVYVEGKLSHLEYGITEQRNPQPFTPPPGNYQIRSPLLKKFGPCTVTGKKLLPSSARPCGFVVSISAEKAPLNLLSFDTLTVKGKIKGAWKVALADEHLAAAEENYPIGECRNCNEQSYFLDVASQHLDLKRMKQLVFILESPSGELQIDHLELRRTPPPPLSLPKPAIWMWDNLPAQADASSVVRNLKALGVRRTYLQIGDELEPLVPFLHECSVAGIEVFALDGAPSYLDNPAPLLDRVRKVREFNDRHHDARFAGFQIDVEPHLNKDFRLRLDSYGSRYIELLERIRTITAGSIPLSTVIPFWYDTLQLQDRTLAWHLIRQSDEAVIMSYRTSSAEIESIARDELFYGEHLSKPILLGVETGPIPDELHVMFSRCMKDSPHSIVAGNSAWCRSGEYTVPGSRISFKGKENDLKELMSSTLPYRSFSGWVIHSYETAPR